VVYEKAYAKINIGLDIKGRRSDGFHDIDTIMQTVGLFDEITICSTRKDIEVVCSSPEIPLDRSNTVYKAAEVFLNHARISSGLKIEIIKKIPAEAGLAGGSSDAAAVIRGLDRLFDTGLSTGDMEKLGSMVGSDVAFCIRGGTARAWGRGEKLKRIETSERVPILILKPGEKVSTGWAYSLYSAKAVGNRPDMDGIEKAVSSGRMAEASRIMANVFEELVFPYKPVIKKAKYDIINTSPLGCIMTGSGSALFAVYDNDSSAEDACMRLEAMGYSTYFVYTQGEVI
jgi:4-diphosphocytidyl-2-C-methyl-D-erythritol kinase